MANDAVVTATESQPTKSVSFPLRSISLRLKDKNVGESASNVDSPEHMVEPLLQSPTHRLKLKRDSRLMISQGATMTKFGWMELNMINSTINSSTLFTRAYEIAAFVNGILKEAGQSV